MIYSEYMIDALATSHTDPLLGNTFSYIDWFDYSDGIWTHALSMLDKHSTEAMSSSIISPWCWRVNLYLSS